MNRQYTSLTALLFDKAGVSAFQASDSTVKCDCNSIKVKLSDHYAATVLELFAHHNNMDQVYTEYNNLTPSAPAVDSHVLSILDKKFGSSYEEMAMLLVSNKVYVCPRYMLPMAYNIDITRQNATGLSYIAKYMCKYAMDRNKIVELTEISRSGASIATALQYRYCGVAVKPQQIIHKHFINTVKQLYTHGLLTAPVGAVEFGDIRRLSPICHDYGYSRGTPVDRYYLNQYIKEISNDVVGDALEIGGENHNCAAYGFANVSSYRAIDACRRPGVDIIGDIHDEKAIECNSLDSILIFNVLEHCRQPWIVVENMFKWLRKYGKVFCMVPNAQRIHKDPQDYWRILPDGMESLFSMYASRKMYVYGNPIAVTAAIMGVAAEELTEGELKYHNTEYPVVTCISAEKQG